MLEHKVEERLVAVGLAGLAGFVDAQAFLELGGFFVSFMSGNTTRLGTGFAESLDAVLVPAGLIGLFVLGVIVATLLTRRLGLGAPGIMALVSGVLAAAAALAWAGNPAMAMALLAFAMGAENGVFVRNGEVTIALTYVTGALVRLGQRLAAAILGGDLWGWIWYLLLWVGLASGAALGTLSYIWIGLAGLWLAAGFGALISIGLRQLSHPSGTP